MPKISVIGVTNRLGGAESIRKALKNQTFTDYEVIIADETGEGFIPRQKQGSDVWNINKAYNDCLDRANGELIVFLQDFIWIPANGLKRFWELYQYLPNDLITGCGHKYDDKKLVETDERVFGDKELVPSDWTYYELNWASCPLAKAPRFEEDMDSHYGGENQIFALNAVRKGAQVWLDRRNECKGQAHHDRPANWELMHGNKGYLNEKIKEIHGRN